MKAHPSPLTVAVIGAGPAGLFAAERLSELGYAVHVFDHMPSVGRKFLMAGRSGLNLTHAEPFERLLTRYGAAQDWLAPALAAFPPAALRAWAEGLGQACFIGSSGRIFPRTMKASPLLRAWLARLHERNVRIKPRHRFTGWTETELHFQTPEGSSSFRADATLLAMGGASWSRLGADGAWTALFPPSAVAPLLPANCGFIPDWAPDLIERHEGAILHSVRIDWAGESARSDITLTRRGLEGSALYALAPLLREEIRRNGQATVNLDMRPLCNEDDLHRRLLAQRPRESQANRLRKALSLNAFGRELLRNATPRDTTPEMLARTLKALPVPLIGAGTLENAISSAGGLRREALDDHYMLRDRPGVFAAGEMLDWEAPTGGYLLQGCFSTAFMAAKGMLRWLESQDSAIA